MLLVPGSRSRGRRVRRAVEARGRLPGGLRAGLLHVPSCAGGSRTFDARALVKDKKHERQTAAKANFPVGVLS